MRASAWQMGIIVAWLLHGCGDSTSGEETGASATASGSGTASTSGEATSPGTTRGEGSSDGTPVTTAADSSTSAPASSGPGTDASSGPGTAGETAGTCEPPPPEGDACLECVVASCCTAWVACQADEPCACVVDCHVVQGGSLGMCSNQCNLDSDLYQALYFCGQGSCLGSCEWDCC